MDSICIQRKQICVAPFILELCVKEDLSWSFEFLHVISYRDCPFCILSIDFFLLFSFNFYSPVLGVGGGKKPIGPRLVS